MLIASEIDEVNSHVRANIRDKKVDAFSPRNNKVPLPGRRKGGGGAGGGAGGERDLEIRSLAARAVVRSSGPMVQ